MSEATRSRQSRSASRSRSRSESKSRKDKKKKKKEKERKPKKREDESPPREKREAEGGDVMSLEETNKLRESLGIEPLADAREEEDEAAINAAKAEARKKVNTERALDEKQKEERRKKLIEKADAKLGGGSLGKQLERETGGSAKDWVSRSRNIGQAKKEAERRAAELAEQEDAVAYDSQNLAGLKLDHTGDQFQEGKMYTLTLKDSRILSKDATSENMEEDTLENLDLVGDEKDERNRKLRAKKGVFYDANDEEANKTLLPQYEDEKEKGTSRLTGEEDERQVRMAEIRNKLKKSLVKVEDDGKGQAHDLTTIQTIPSDYLPAKPEKFKRRRKKEKHARTSLKSEGKADDGKLLFDEDRSDVAKHQEDHASRSGASVKERNDQLQADRKKQLKDAAYLKAMKKAEKGDEEDREDANEEEEKQIDEPPRQKSVKDEDFIKTFQKAEKESRKKLESIENIFDDEHDEELQSSLDRSRRLAQSKRIKQEEELKAEEEITHREKRFSASIRSLGVKEESDEDEMHDEVKPDDMVFTATTEFCRGLSSVSMVDAPAAEKEEKSQASTQKETTRTTAAKEKLKAIDENEDLSDDEEMSAKVTNENKEFMGEEPMANRGAAAALQLAKLRGLLKEEVSQAGRSQDGSYHYDDPAPNISLVYLDEFGRPMKPKEAFRQLSHVFHGRPPGPVKQEKKLKQFREEQRRGRILYGSRKSTLDNFVKKQKKQGEAYVVLDGSKKGAYDVGAGVNAGNPKRKRVEDDLNQGGI